MLPNPNLNPSSQPWARAITVAVQENTKDIDVLKKAMLSDNRAMAGQMGAVGRQVNELGSRSTRIVSAANLSVTATSSTSFSTATRNVNIPGEGRTSRHALISVSAPVSRSGDAIGPFITILFDGSVMFRDTVGQSTGGRVPDDWGNSLTTTFSAIVPPDGGTLAIRMQLSMFSGSSASATLSNIRVSTYFTDRPSNQVE